MEKGSPLGEYLRARRETLTPEDVGLPSTGRRRTRGLRREEAALLAGISAEHYLRLEQGNDKHPSDQVLDGLASALRLDANETAHLHRLARPATGRRRADPGPEYVSPSLEYLVSSWTDQAAIVQGRLMNVLASNALAVAVSPAFTVGVNGLRAAFLDPAVRELNRDWEAMTERMVAGVRAMVGPNYDGSGSDSPDSGSPETESSDTSKTDDPQFTQLVEELTQQSERFRYLWARKKVRPRSSEISLLQHPVVGPLDLHYERLAIEGAGGQTLVIFHAEPGTPSEAGLKRLALSAAGPQEAEPPLPAPVSINSRRRTT